MPRYRSRNLSDAPSPGAARLAGSRLALALGGFAGGAAHLPGMTAALTAVPVLGVPVESATLKGVDSLYSIVQMPGGIPTATFAIGNAGATNAALFAIQILSLHDKNLAQKLLQWRKNRADKALDGNEIVQEKYLKSLKKQGKKEV